MGADPDLLSSRPARSAVERHPTAACAARVAGGAGACLCVRRLDRRARGRIASAHAVVFTFRLSAFSAPWTRPCPGGGGCCRRCRGKGNPATGAERPAGAALRFAARQRGEPEGRTRLPLSDRVGLSPCRPTGGGGRRV